MVARYLFCVVTSFLVGKVMAQECSIVLLQPNPHSIPEARLLTLAREHLTNQRRWMEEGKLLLSGPLDEGGLMVVSLTSEEEVNAMFQSDSAVSQSLWNIEILPALQIAGSLCSRFDPNDLEQYTLVRLTSNITKYNVKRSGKIIAENDRYFQALKLNGILVAQFDLKDRLGIILVFMGELDHEVLEESPGVRSTLFTFERQRLWVPKGSFCQ